jgi:hypothetical protein
MRVENVDRDKTLIVGEQPAHGHFEHDPIGRVQAYTFGFERDLGIGPSPLNIGLGIQATVYGLPESLKSTYGSRPAGLTVFLHLRPTGNMKEHMQLMRQQ